jgi:hypothetical protein
MKATGRRPGLFWALVLVAAGVTVGLGASSSRAGAVSPPAAVCPFCPTTTTTPDSTTSVPDTTSTTSPVDTSTTSVPPPTPYSASFVPCSASGPSGPCDQTPQQVQLAYPAATPPAAIEVDWVADGRSAAAPNPDSTSAVLVWSDGRPCGTAERCWPWPSALTAGAYVLNGTYQVLPCGTYASGACQSTFPPSSVGLAVPPYPPASVTATLAGSQVTIDWAPPPSRPPDLAGYALSRNGRDLYICSTDDLGPGASLPCPQSLSVADHPGAGRYSYAVRTIRLGVDTASRDVVSSSSVGARGGGVTVTGSTTGSGGSGPPATGSVPGSSTGSGSGPAASTGPTTTTVPGAKVGTHQSASAHAVTSGPTGVVADPAPKAALTLKVPSRTDVVPVAVLALGILLLAVAAHFLYLRVELGVVASRVKWVRRGPE